MKISWVVPCGSVALLLLAGCATTGDSRRADWPSPYRRSYFGAIWHYYQPELLGSPEEAIGAIKNLQNDFCALQGYTDKNVDIDAYGLRLQTRGVETRTGTQYVPSYGGAWVGNTYVPIYGGSYQDYTTKTPVTDNAVVPFPQVSRMAIFFLPALNREFKWLLDIHLDGAETVRLRAISREKIVALANAIATLVAQHRPFASPLEIILHNLTPEQLAKEGLPHGVLVVGVAEGGLAARAGLQYRDLITQINGAEVSDAVGVQRSLAETPAGETVTLTFLRWESSKDENGRTVWAWVEHHADRPPRQP